MPKPTKYSAVSERMPSPYRGKRGGGRGADLLKLVKQIHMKVEESWGACRNTTKKVRRNRRKVPKCTNYRVVLGNGLCQDCWDKQIDRKANNVKTNMPSNGNE